MMCNGLMVFMIFIVLPILPILLIVLHSDGECSECGERLGRERKAFTSKTKCLECNNENN